MMDPEATKDDLVRHLRTVHGLRIEYPQRTTKSELVLEHRAAHQKEAEEEQPR